jgi:large subunit ribosomal protein L15
MQIHQLRRTKKRKKEKKIGRGGKRGTYCGRGIKGQKARAGRKLKPIIREVLKKYPKKRGYRFSAKKDYRILNLREIERAFNEREKVTPEILVEKRLVRRISGKIPKVKILGKGEITKKLIFENLLFSKLAKEKIEKAGGKIL